MTRAPSVHAALDRLIGGAVSAVAVLAAFARLLGLASRALRGTSPAPRLYAPGRRGWLTGPLARADHSPTPPGGDP